jgi:hypothetical protein
VIVYSTNSGNLFPGGPAQSDLLTHFCGRGGAGAEPSLDVPQNIRDMDPQERLENILWEGVLRGSRGFSRPDTPKTVSFSESPGDHLRWLIRDKGWPSWGLVFHRQAIYEAGGGPVWHVRTETLCELSSDLAAWAVRLDTTPGQVSEWLHEREWRLRRDAFELDPSMMRAILVGDPEWEPVREVWTGGCVDIAGLPAAPGSLHAVADERVPGLPPLWRKLPRWYYDPRHDAIVELDS